MAVAVSATRQVALNASTATSLCGSNNDTNAGVPRTIIVTASADVYIGIASNVTSSTGFKLTSGNTLSLALNAGQQLYAIAASATPTAYVIDQVS